MKNIHRINGNIYITSDEEIKEGDWFVVKLFKITGESDGFHIEKCTKLDDVWCNNFDVISTRHKNNCKKIILTTDQDLIKDGVQAVEEGFLNWFVKNPSCEFVEIDKQDWFDAPNTITYYKIIIPKEEPKQETLEEVAGKFYSEQSEAYEDEIEAVFDTSRYLVEGFIAGAKWHEENVLSNHINVLAERIADNYSISYMTDDGIETSKLKKEKVLKIANDYINELNLQSSK